MKFTKTIKQYFFASLIIIVLLACLLGCTKQPTVENKYNSIGKALGKIVKWKKKEIKKENLH